MKTNAGEWLIVEPQTDVETTTRFAATSAVRSTASITTTADASVTKSGGKGKYYPCQSSTKTTRLFTSQLGAIAFVINTKEKTL